MGENVVAGGGPSGWLSIKGTVGTTKAIVCPGDSGGGAFANASVAPGDGNDDGWRVVAVNSAVGRMKDGSDKDYISYLAPLSDISFATFLRGWAAKRSAQRRVCGLDLSYLDANCRK